MNKQQQIKKIANT
jgi:uncharacterized protein YkwD